MSLMMTSCDHVSVTRLRGHHRPGRPGHRVQADPAVPGRLILGAVEDDPLRQPSSPVFVPPTPAPGPSPRPPRMIAFPTAGTADGRISRCCRISDVSAAYGRIEGRVTTAGLSLWFPEGSV